jgi:hypothetical protein
MVPALAGKAGQQVSGPVGVRPICQRSVALSW